MNLKDIFFQILTTFLITLVFFAIFDTFLSSIIELTLLNAEDITGLYVVIIFLGFILGLIISIIVNYIASESEDRLSVFYASILATITSFLIILAIAYIFVLREYPYLVYRTSDLTIESLFIAGYYYIIATPEILAYYAIYILDSYMLYWVLSILIYTISYGVFLYLYSKRNSRK